MNRLVHKLQVRLRSLFYRHRVEHELNDELRFHLGKLFEEKLAKGLNPEEAHYAAVRELGGIELIKEECRDVRRVNYIENFLQTLVMACASFAAARVSPQQPSSPSRSV